MPFSRRCAGMRYFQSNSGRRPAWLVDVQRGRLRQSPGMQNVGRAGRPDKIAAPAGDGDRHEGDKGNGRSRAKKRGAGGRALSRQQRNPVTRRGAGSSSRFAAGLTDTGSAGVTLLCPCATASYAVPFAAIARFPCFCRAIFREQSEHVFSVHVLEAGGVGGVSSCQDFGELHFLQWMWLLGDATAPHLEPQSLNLAMQPCVGSRGSIQGASVAPGLSSLLSSSARSDLDAAPATYASSTGRRS